MDENLPITARPVAARRRKTVAPTHKDGPPARSARDAARTEAGILAAAETHGRVFFVRVDPKTGQVSSPVSPEIQAKHPVAIANSKGETLFAWAEGTGWNKGGAVAFQIFDKESKPMAEKGRAEGLQPWSLPTAFVERDGNFTIVY